MNRNKAPSKGYPVLLAQLVVANVIVAAAVTATLYWIFSRLKDAYFINLTEEFLISPTKLNSMFTMDVEQSLWWGIVVALALGIALSLLLTRALLRPISQMIRATEKIAEGDLSARAPTLKGELGSLSWHLNDMAGALEKQEEGRQQLLRDLSHELRTPLTNVKGYIEGLEDGVFTSGPEVFNVLNTEVARLNDLIGDLSELSLSENIVGGLQLEQLDLKQQIVSIVAAHKAAMLETSFQIQVKEMGAPKPIAADKKRLQQIFNNAISNMVRYAISPNRPKTNSRDGEIIIDWTKQDLVTVRFENWAEPISEEDLARLFDRFFRADKSRSGKSNNVGLGLSIVRRLVSAHSGKSWVAQSEGRFSLNISFPLQKEN
ncbi:MAG: ATP-binding protein [Devosiaceae bacterium]|nr:ATP-binding protein [Devosiaceae bacterium]